MFKRLREKLAASLYKKQLTEWQDERDGYERLQLARTYKGDSSSDIMLKPGEAVFAIVGGAALVEDVRGPGQWEGNSSSVSIPIGSLGGRSVRYTAGRSKGHYIQGTPTPTAIDTGTVYITNQRIIFQGGKQTRECLWSKLIGLQHDDEVGKTAFSASNRQKPLIILYGPKASAWFDFRLGLALAHYRNTVPALVTQLEGELADLDARKPQPPAEQPKPQPPAEQPESDSSQRPGWWRRFRSLPRAVQIASWIGLTVIILIIIGSTADQESGTGNTAPTSLSATSTPTAVARTSPPTTVAPRPTPTTAPAVAPTPTPAPVPPQKTTPPAAAPPASTCHPLTSTGNCYRPGQYCRTADRGTSGVAANGQKIVCKNNNGWRWEAV